jgi:hypothetical protein
MAVLRCRACGQLWAKEYPFSEAHGSGPPCLYQVSISDPYAWLSSGPSLAVELICEQESQDCFSSLGPEVGPERCASLGCKAFRIKLSVMCRSHHVEMLERARGT